jgi:Protein kinase domain
MSSGYSGSAHSLFRGLGAGSRLAGYLIEEQIGTGGMAVVFRARDEVLGRLAAVKVIAPSLADDGEFRARFLHESQAAAAVDSLHIIPVYGAGEAKGLLYIAIRFVAGGDLAALMRRSGGWLEPGRVVPLVSQVASALDAAHAAGLVHRDVKPQNILVDAVSERAEHAYLSDFGLSRTTASTGLTASGAFLGTPDYCAPEQVKSARVDGQADQYALGCVAFALLTGTAPFHREDTLGTLFAHVQDPVPLVTGLRPQLPPAVDGVIARALAKSPDDRYARCGEFAAALQEALVPDHPATVTVRYPGPAGNQQPAGVSHLSQAGRCDPARPSATADAPAATAGDAGYADTITTGNTSAGLSERTPRPVNGTRQSRRKALQIWAAGAAAVVLAAGALTVLLLHRSPSASPGRANQGPTHTAVSQASSRPTASTTSSHSRAGAISPSRVLAAGKYGFSLPENIADDGTHIWVTNGKGNSVTELNASDGKWIRTLSGGNYGFGNPYGIVSDDIHIWVTNFAAGSVTELNASDGAWIRTLPGFSYPANVVASGTHIWVTNYAGNSLTELNSSDGTRIRTLSGGSYGFNGPYGIADDGTHVWVANDGGSVTELNASDGTWIRTLSGGNYGFNRPDHIAISGTHIWVTNFAGDSVTELNASDGA